MRQRVILLVTSTTSSSSKKDFTIYIGDSRTVGMCSYVSLPSSAKYCDVYSSIANNYRTIDGVHYDENTYKSIYNAIKKCLD